MGKSQQGSSRAATQSKQQFNNFADKRLHPQRKKILDFTVQLKIIYCHVLHHEQSLKLRLDNCTAEEAGNTEKPCKLWDVRKGSALQWVTSSGLFLHDPAKGEGSTGILVAEDIYTARSAEFALQLHLHCVPVFLLFPSLSLCVLGHVWHLMLFLSTSAHRAPCPE